MVKRFVAFIQSLTYWRPRPPFYYGWLVLGTLGLGTLAATGTTQIVLGGIQSLIFEDMEWDRSTIAYAVTGGTWLGGLLTPLVGRLADRYGARGLATLSALIVGLCLLALAETRAVWHFYVAYIIARGVGNPHLIGVVPRTAAVNFFHRRRNLALGLASMVRPVGGAAMIQIIALIAAAASWRVAYHWLGFFALALVVPLFLIIRRRPEDIGLLPDGETRPAPHEESSRATVHRTHPSAPTREFNWRLGEAALTPTYWLIVAAESLVTLTTGAVLFQIVPYLKDSGLSFAAATGALSISLVLGALVNPGWGYLADRFAPRGLLVLALAATAVTTLMFLATDSGKLGFFIVPLWGAAAGGLNILGIMMLVQYFGRASFGSITGLMGPFQTGALGLGPTLGAVLFSLTDGYDWLFIYALAAYFLAILLVYSARPPRLPHRASARGQAADR